MNKSPVKTGHDHKETYAALTDVEDSGSNALKAVNA